MPTVGANSPRLELKQLPLVRGVFKNCFFATDVLPEVSEAFITSLEEVNDLANFTLLK